MAVLVKVLWWRFAIQTLGFYQGTAFEDQLEDIFCQKFTRKRLNS
jgi:hypothetical protein